MFWFDFIERNALNALYSSKKMNSNVSLYGKCRCCRTEGEHRDVMKEYFVKGIREVYFDMFLECFNVFLSTLSGTSNLICVECIQRLRDANAFRMMVVNAEKELQACEQNVFSAASENINHTEIKEEAMDIVKEEPDDSQLLVEIDCERFDNSETLEDSRRLDKDEAQLIARFPPSTLKMLPSRNTLYDVCPKYALHLDMLQGKKISTKHLEALLRQDRDCDQFKTNMNKKIYVTEKHALITNSLVILENSNVTAFKSNSSNGLPCYYCIEVLENIERLREHQKQHTVMDIKKSLAKRTPECMVVNVDTTDLKCTICDVAMSNLKELKSHLLTVHRKKMYTEFEDRIIPFKITMDNDFCCQICGVKYETFGSLERHMNAHYRNYICDGCGTGFATSHRMKVHIRTMHVDGNFPCELCSKVFPSHQKLKSHVDTVHKSLKRFKCPKCSERFTDYFKRHQHLVDQHGVPELEYKCNVCDKVFTRRFMLTLHTRKVHLEEKCYQCDICSNKFYAKRNLESHMVKHNGARIFECEICQKAYARKKTLKEHMRIHNNDRRFACSVCGQAFVQNCSLKGHIKTHHPEMLEYGIGN